MKYPIRYPLAKLFASLGAVMLIRIDVTYDDEAQVYIATSKDLTGLILEAETFAELKKEAENVIPELLHLENQDYVTDPDVVLRNHIVIA